MNYQYPVEHVYVVVSKDYDGKIKVEKVYESESDAYIHVCKGKEDHGCDFNYYCVEKE